MPAHDGDVRSTPPASPRTSIQLLLDRSFGILFWGKLASLIASWALMIVVILLVYDATGSSGWAGAVTAAQLGPQLVLALVSGRLADSHGPIGQIVAGGLVSGVAALALAGWTAAAGVDNLSPVPLLIASVTFGCGLALSAPSMHAIVPRLVLPQELSSAVALNFFPTALARTVGPAGGAALVVLFGPLVSLVVIGVVFVVSSVLFCFIRMMRSTASRRASDSSILGSLKYVARERVLVVLLLGVAAIGAGSEPAITLAPALVELVGRSTESAGLVASFFGAGGLLGVIAHKLLSRRFTPAVEGCLAMVMLAVAMGIVGIAGSIVVLSAALVVGGLSMVVGITAFSVAIQQRCAESMLGRVMALWVLAFAGVRPLAGLLQGLVSDHASTRVAVEATVVLLVVAVGFVAVVVARDRRAGAPNTPLSTDDDVASATRPS